MLPRMEELMSHNVETVGLIKIKRLSPGVVVRVNAMLLEPNLPDVFQARLELLDVVVDAHGLHIAVAARWNGGDCLFGETTESRIRFPCARVANLLLRETWGRFPCFRS